MNWIEVESPSSTNAYSNQKQSDNIGKIFQAEAKFRKHLSEGEMLFRTLPTTEIFYQIILKILEVIVRSIIDPEDKC